MHPSAGITEIILLTQVSSGWADFAQYLQHVRHCGRLFTYIILFNPHNILSRYTQLIISVLDKETDI